MGWLGVPIELKFAGDTAPGSFEGYASVYGVIDRGGDMLVPRAFERSLAEYKAAGLMPPMRMMHGHMLGGDPRPIGVWDSIEDDGSGLKVRGHLLNLDTDTGRTNYGLVKGGATRGLSIGYKVMPGGATYSSKVGDPHRTIKQARLGEISIVDDPMNVQSMIDGIKSATSDEIDELKSLSEAEDFLREAERLWSKKSARDFVGRVVKIARREAGDDRNVAGLLEQIRSTKRLILPTS